MQHSMPFHEIARTKHRNDFEFVAILLHLETGFIVKMLYILFQTIVPEYEK